MAYNTDFLIFFPKLPPSLGKGEGKDGGGRVNKLLESEKPNKEYHIWSDFRSDLSADRKRNPEERKEREKEILSRTTSVNENS